MRRRRSRWELSRLISHRFNGEEGSGVSKFNPCMCVLESCRNFWRTYGIKNRNRSTRINGDGSIVGLNSRSRLKKRKGAHVDDWRHSWWQIIYIVMIHAHTPSTSYMYFSRQVDIWLNMKHLSNNVFKLIYHFIYASFIINFKVSWNEIFFGVFTRFFPSIYHLNDL